MISCFDINLSHSFETSIQYVFEFMKKKYLSQTLSVWGYRQSAGGDVMWPNG